MASAVSSFSIHPTKAIPYNRPNAMKKLKTTIIIKHQQQTTLIAQVVGMADVRHIQSVSHQKLHIFYSLALSFRIYTIYLDENTQRLQYITNKYSPNEACTFR